MVDKILIGCLMIGTLCVTALVVAVTIELISHGLLR